MTFREILIELRSNPTVSVPTAGKALGDMSKNGSYRAAADGRFPCPIIDFGGGTKRVASAVVLRLLGLNPEVLLDDHPAVEPPPSRGAAPAETSGA
jgi:hypothetical protein